MIEPTKITIGELLEALSECAQNKADLKAMITELADALCTWRNPYGHQSELIQRAREAVK